MKFYQEGDTGKALCNECERLVSTTFKRRDVPFSDGKGIARSILAGVCDVCDAVVALPAQSTPAIREARDREWVSLEANLPAVYIDMLDMAIHTVNQAVSSQFRKVLLAFFLHRLANDAAAGKQLADAHETLAATYQEPRGVTRRRLSMKLSARIASDLEALTQASRLNQTELLKSVIYLIQNEVVVARKPALLKQLGQLCAIVA